MSKTVAELLGKIVTCSSPEDSNRMIQLLSARSTEVTAFEKPSEALFFALTGRTQDGNAFIQQVLDSGALCVAKAGSHPRRPGLLECEDPKQALIHAAERFWDNPSGKMKVLGVTGTNGKTTSTFLIESILNMDRQWCGLIGTIENRFLENAYPATHTTPDLLKLYQLCAEFRRKGARAIALEVTSHALDQQRIGAFSFECVLFTNLTQDHLDYHGDMENYYSVKQKLFMDYIARYRVINASDRYGQRLIEACAAAGYLVHTYGKGSRHALDFSKLRSSLSGIHGEVSFKTGHRKEVFEIQSPLIGEFNIENIAGVVCAALLCDCSVESIQKGLSGAFVPGRLERLENSLGFHIYIDYAHTPDALQRTLEVLRPEAKNLICVFGCGGDRDQSKRLMMGQVASQYSDSIIVTSDNPRFEDPQKIVDDILEGIPEHRNKHIDLDRRSAILFALDQLAPGDVLLIAGKGHEKTQTIGDQALPFEDSRVVREWLNQEN